MKISKIKNSRPGISVTENKNEEQLSRQSLLYYAPVKDGKIRLESKDLEQHVTECNEKAQKLYNVITPEIDLCKEENREWIVEDLTKNFNAVINNALRSIKNPKEKREERVEKEVAFILNLNKNSIKIKKDVFVKSTDLIVKFSANNKYNKKNDKGTGSKEEAYIREMISNLVLRKLKKTLRKEVKLENGCKMQMTEITISLMSAICLYGNVESFDPVILKAFFEKVDSDYTKYKYVEQIVKSIEFQSAKLKVVEKDGKHLLIPANADHRKKKYVFEFMRKYAAAEEKEKREITEHIQNLIGLYLCGKAGYENAENRFSNMTESHNCISGEIEEIFNEIEELENSSKQKREEKKKTREELDKIQESRKGNKRNTNSNNQNYKNNKTDSDKKENQADANENKLKENELRDKRRRLSKELENLDSEVRIKKEKLKNTTVKEMALKYRAAVNYLADEVGKTVLGEIKEKKVRSCADLYWIEYIDSTVEKLLLKSRNKDRYRYEIGFLSKHIWKEWTQYISGKYIEMGKGVYHFAIPDLSGALEGESVSICEVKPEYRNGVSGFDYERIRAEESLEREMEKYVLFAVNNFARAVTPEEEREKPGHEDVLLMKTLSEIEESQTEEERQKKHDNNVKNAITLYADADRRILQFFGGQSRFRKKEDSLINLYSGEDLYKEIRKELYAIRNITFHYTTKADKDQTQKHELTEYFFEEEFSDITELFREKYYTNNVWKYYDIEVINNIMGKIYCGRKYRAAQVPAFNNIISRPALPQLMDGFVKGNSLRRLMNCPDRDVIKKYWSSLFFVLKELYYYDFLQEQEKPEDNIKERFFRAMEKESGQAKDGKEQKAWESFENRIDQIGRERSFGAICQGLMVEYMLQNRDISMVQTETGDGKTNKKQIYKHYRTLLYICIRSAFTEYLREKWEELRTPVLTVKEWSKEEFCRIDGLKHLSLFDHLKETFNDAESGSFWYMAAHFINQKYLNHLIGSIRNYLQFTEDIEDRALSLGDCVDNKREEKNLRYRNTLEILEFVAQFCERTTNVMEDYFESNQEYAAYLSGFVDYNVSKKETDIEKALYGFCRQKFKVDGKEYMAGIYYDGENLIPNRNIIRANMYGNVSCLKPYMDRITLKEIRTMYADQNKLDTVLKEGVCRTEEEQKAYREYQNEKNRIELFDLCTYTQILNDIQAKLIGWSYMRERDLMYYQLGYYYTKLFWTDSISEEDARRRLMGELVNVEDGVILYQILAFNSYNLPIIANKNNTVTFLKGEGSIGGKAITAFLKNYENAERIYEEALDLFENTDEHAAIINTRNYIEHFKYFIKSDRSMMDLYSEVYDRFFRHDHNRKKNVPDSLKNVLADNFMIADISMELGSKKVGEKKKGFREHKAARIEFTDRGIRSTDMTYTVKPDPKDSKKDEKVLVPARSEVFLKQFQKILEYRI